MVIHQLRRMSSASSERAADRFHSINRPSGQTLSIWYPAREVGSGWLPALGTRGFHRPLSDPSTDLQVRCHGSERDGRDVPKADTRGRTDAAPEERPNAASAGSGEVRLAGVHRIQPQKSGRRRRANAYHRMKWSPVALPDADRPLAPNRPKPDTADRHDPPARSKTTIDCVSVRYHMPATCRQ